MQNTLKVLKDHCVFCFSVLDAALLKQDLPEFPKHLPVFEAPVFITFHIDKEELRGCIGTFSSGPLDK
jgi:AMMECR1 domain-containing protein